uniref:helix-turn-helix domain-containing protein n=1 Tax=Serratia marcescens TaxID=615 RepID=UPI0011E77951
AELKEKGYSQYVIRRNKLLSQVALANIREKKPLPITALNAICIMLQKQPSDIIEVDTTSEDRLKYFTNCIFK